MQLFLVTVQMKYFNWLEECFYFFDIGNLLPAIVLKNCIENIAVLSLKGQHAITNKVYFLQSKKQLSLLNYTDVSQKFMNLQ